VSAGESKIMWKKKEMNNTVGCNNNKMDSEKNWEKMEKKWTHFFYSQCLYNAVLQLQSEKIYGRVQVFFPSLLSDTNKKKRKPIQVEIYKSMKRAIDGVKWL